MTPASCRGGIPGVNNLAADPDVRRVCDACNAAGKRVAAICAAPTVLAGFGLLEGRKATVYPGMDDGLAGAIHTGDEVTVDGNITTGRALGARHPLRPPSWRNSWPARRPPTGCVMPSSTPTDALTPA